MYLSHLTRFIALSLLLIALASCSTFKPEDLNYSSVRPADKNSPLNYGVYTPPNWQPGERLPLIVFLHGGGGSHLSFERYGANEYLDTEIVAGRVARAIIVLPDGDNGFWENWADGTRNYRDWVLNDVVPKVQQDYQTLDCPEHCHLAGISMGGYGVLRMAYFAKDQYSSVSAISAPIFNREQAKDHKPSLLIRLIIPFKRIFGEEFSPEFIRSNPYNAWVSEPRMRDLRLQLIRGSDENDHIIDSNERFHERLSEAEFEHEYFIYKGGHKWRFWVPHLGRVVNFLVNDSSYAGGSRKRASFKSKIIPIEEVSDTNSETKPNIDT